MFDINVNFEKVLDYIDNPIVKGILAASGTTAIIAATTAFAPVGVVGAAGWTLVYWVFGGTLTFDVAKRMWNSYQNMSKENKKSFDVELDKVKRMFDEGVISKEKFNQQAEALYKKYAG